MARGGAVSVVANQVVVRNKGQIRSVTAGKGNAGDITVNTTGLIEIEGDGTSAQTGVFSQSVDVGLSPAIGNSGTVTVTAQAVSIKNSGQISTLSTTGGNAGDVTVTANGGDIIIDGKGRIQQTGIETSSTATVGGGAAGNVTVTARNITLLAAGTIQNEVVSSQAGTVKITAGGILSIDALGGRGLPTGISSSRVSGIGKSPGNAGTVTVTAKSINLKGKGGTISAFSSTGNAGSVTVNSTLGNIDVSDLANISVRASAVGSKAGDIILDTPTDILVHGGGKLNASAAGSGGNIDATARFIVLDNYNPKVGPLVTARAEQGKGGVITVDSLSFLPDDPRLLDVNSTAGSPGTLTVRSEFDLVGSTVLPQVSFAQADNRLRLECQRDQPFSNTLDLSGAGQGAMMSDSTLGISPCSFPSSGPAGNKRQVNP